MAIKVPAAERGYKPSREAVSSTEKSRAISDNLREVFVRDKAAHVAAQEERYGIPLTTDAKLAAAHKRMDDLAAKGELP